MSIFSKTLQTATDEVCSCSWSGSPKGLRFRCKMCGHRFKPGDRYRFVYANGTDSPTRTGNFAVCGTCDGDDAALLERMAEIEREAYTRFWWLVDDDRQLASWEEKR